MNKADSPRTDQELLLGTVRRDEGDFAVLFDRYSAPLYNYLLRLVQQREVAEELLQEVFVAVWKGAGGFGGRSSVSTWLFRIAYHKAVGWLRRRQTESLEGLEHLPGDERPEEDAFDGWVAGRLAAALGQLSPDHRAVLELTFVQGLSYREVAQVVGCPVGTVKSRVSYARRFLRGVLERMGIER